MSYINSHIVMYLIAFIQTLLIINIIYTCEYTAQKTQTYDVIRYTMSGATYKYMYHQDNNNYDFNIHYIQTDYGRHIMFAIQTQTCTLYYLLSQNMTEH